MIVSGVQVVSAHEHRQVTMGGLAVELEVGWLVEPAYVDEVNGIDFHATIADTGEPVFGLDQALQVEVSTGDKGVTVGLSPVLTDDEPRLFLGAYEAHLIPTVEGSYAFRFFGNVNGTSVNESFQCGPTTFECVTAASEIQFPEPTPSGRALQVELQDLRSQVSQLQTGIQLAYVIGAAGVLVALASFAAVILAVRRGKKTS
jgi:hypothetical protein